MALNDLIAEGGRPVAVQSPETIIGNMLSLRNAGILNQQRQIQTQRDQIDLQNQQVAQKTAADVRNAYAAGTTMDPKTGMPTLDRGVMLSTLGQANPQAAAAEGQRLQAIDVANSKQQAETTEAQLKTAAAHTSYIAQHLQGVLSQPTPELQQQAYTSSRNQMITDGVLKPGGPDDPGPVLDAGIVQRQLDQTLTQQQAIENKLKIQDQANTAARDAATALHQTNEDAETAKYHAGELRQGNQRTAIEAGRLSIEQQRLKYEQSYAPANASGLTGEDFLKTLNPAIAAQVKATANGDIAIPPAGSRNAGAQALRSAVLSYDPTFTDARYATKQNFKTKGDANSLVQLTTALKHADNASTNSAAVGYAPFIENSTLQTATDAAYMKDVQYLTGEVGKLVTGGVLTVDEGKKLTSGLDSARGGVRDKSLKETLDLLSGKVSGIFQKYKAGTGQDIPIDQFFDKDTRARLQKYGIVAAPASSGGFNWNDHPVAK